MSKIGLVPAVRPRFNQDGSVLLVVVVLLMLASLFVVFSLNIGRFEQQTSGNDVRAKLTQDLAEAGMHQGIEYFNANRAVVKADANWEACGTSVAFPCGAVPAARRATMLRFKGGTGTGGVLVPLPSAITSTGGYVASQQVGAVLCRIKKQAVVSAATECTTDSALASTTWLVTVVSKGSLTDEKSSATVTQTIGASNVFGLGPNVPPVLASGPVTFGANSTIVAGANAGGDGVPVSVWTRGAFSGNGNPNTCQMDAFQRNGSARYYEDITVCDNCSCPATDSLSAGKGSTYCMGMDIVNIDGSPSATCTNGGVTYTSNADIKRAEFPPDLFGFIFGQTAWRSTNTGADTYANEGFNFGDERVKASCTYPNPATGAPVTVADFPQDTCFLLNIGGITHIGDGVRDTAECDALTDNSPGTTVGGIRNYGIVWIHSQKLTGTVPELPGKICDPTGVDQLGTPKHPIALIYDGSPGNWQVNDFFGLLFLREPHASDEMDASTGGSVAVKFNGGTRLYGAVVVQGQVQSQGGGGATIVHSDSVLRNLVNDPLNESPSSVPGSWTDKLRY